MLHVLATHSTITPGFPAALIPFVHWLVDGELAVRTFFLLSGFLITWLLLVEVDTSGRISLSRFYVRRALRILPVYVAFVAALFWLDRFTPYRQTPEAWIGNLTFTTNFVPFSKLNWTSGHLWSLAVEEQFYFVWPVLFWLCGVRKDRRASWWILAVPLVVAPLWRYLTWMTAAPQSTPYLFQGFATFNFFDSIAMGCLCALLYARAKDQLGRWMTARPVVTAVTGALLILIPHVLTRAMLLRIVTTPFGHTMQAMGVGILVMQSVFMPANGFYRILNWPIVSGLGLMSYSVYVWQQIFSTRSLLLGLRREWWMSFPGWLVPALGVGLISYFVLERPFIRLRARLRHRSTVSTASSGPPAFPKES